MLVSVITVNKNDAAGLERTIKSVITQTYSNIEYIVIDGDSSDTSIEIIKKHQNSITKWISESDTGIYNAMNKGITLSTGEYALFLNSGDHFFSIDSLQKLISKVCNQDLICGDLLYVEDNNLKTLKTLPNSLRLSYFIENSLPHPSTLIKTKILQKYSGYDERYKIVSDFDFFLKVLLDPRTTYLHVQETVSVFYLDGISSKPEYNFLMQNERDDSLKRAMPIIYEDYHDLCDLYRDNLLWYLFQKRTVGFIRFFAKLVRKLFG